LDISTLWIVVLSIATPVAGVVGFALQLRQVKKGRLENEKLQLEILALKEKMAQADQRIVKPTNEEVLLVNHGQMRLSRRGQILESRRAPGDSYSSVESERQTPKPTLRERLEVAGFIVAFVLFVAYFLFDIYRLLAWLASWF
jgi:hypothetical protein